VSYPKSLPKTRATSETVVDEVEIQHQRTQVLDEAMWEEARPWEEKWESLKMNQSKMTEQELDDEDKQ
jgi:hypothetical protein